MSNIKEKHHKKWPHNKKGNRLKFPFIILTAIG